MLRLLHLDHGSLVDCSNRSLSPIVEMDLLSIAPAVNLCFSVVVVAAALALTLVIAVPTLAVVVALVLTLVIVRGSHFVVVIAILL